METIVRWKNRPTFQRSKRKTDKCHLFIGDYDNSVQISHSLSHTSSCHTNTYTNKHTYTNALIHSWEIEQWDKFIWLQNYFETYILNELYEDSFYKCIPKNVSSKINHLSNPFSVNILKYIVHHSAVMPFLM